MKKRNIFILGTLIGAAASLLFTPKTGKEFKQDLLNKLDDAQAKLKDFEVSEAKQVFTTKLEEIKEMINNFDWESSKIDLEIKFEEVKEKIADITEYLDEAKTSITEEAQTLSENLEEDFTLVIDTVKDTVVDAVKDTVDQAKTTAADVADIIKEDSKLVTETAKEVVDQAKIIASDVVETIKE